MLRQAVPRLMARNIQLDFCCIGGRGDLDSAFIEQGSLVHVFPRRLQWSRGRREVSSILASYQYDVVHSQFGFTSSGILAASKLHRTPCIVSIHNTRGPGHRLNRVPCINKARDMWLSSHKNAALRHATMILGHSQANLDAYHRAWNQAPNLFRVLYNGVETRPNLLDPIEAKCKLGLSPSCKLVLNVGAMKAQKNHEGLLRIFEIMCRNRSDLHLSIVGDGPMRSKVEALIDALKIKNRVTLHGRQDDVSQFYAAADVFLFPSHFEGFGNVLVEAQAAGVPVVASDLASIREAVCPLQHRFLCVPNNHSLAAQLACEQLSPSKTRETVILKSQEFVRANFSIEQFCDNLSACYIEAVASTPKEHAVDSRAYKNG